MTYDPAANNRITWRTKVEELAASPYADEDRVVVPIRFGDIRAIRDELADLAERFQQEKRASLVLADMLAKARGAASGMEAATAGETTKIGSTEGDSPARDSGDAQNRSEPQ